MKILILVKSRWLRRASSVVVRIVRNRCVVWTMAGVALLLFVAGCGRDYEIERLMWKADRIARPLLQNRQRASRGVVDGVIRRYKTVIAQAGNDHPRAMEAKFIIGQLHTLAEQYGPALQVYDDVVAHAADDTELIAAALFHKALIYELQNDWTAALRELETAVRMYPVSRTSLEIPLYIARYYSRQEQYRQADRSYDLARRHYQALLGQHADSEIALQCATRIILSFVDQELWRELADYIEQLGQEYRLGPDMLMILARLYRGRLADRERAQYAYQRIIELYPDSPLAKLAAIERATADP